MGSAVKRGVKLAFSVCCLLSALLGIYLYSLPAPVGLPILEYHMVTSKPVDSDGETYNVSPEEFSRQLDYLAAEGYNTISLLDYMKARKGKLALPEKPLVLTFDDGYENNYREMLPILEAHGMKATVYVIVNRIGTPGYLTWDELKEMEQRGIELGSHSANHLPLTELSPEQQQDELYLSKLLMEWKGLKTIFTFSYPNGAYDDKLPKMLEENKYLTAVTGDGGINTPDTDPYLLQRINIPKPCFGLTEFKWRLWKGEIMAQLGLWQHKKR